MRLCRAWLSIMLKKPTMRKKTKPTIRPSPTVRPLVHLSAMHSSTAATAAAHDTSQLAFTAVSRASGERGIPSVGHGCLHRRRAGPRTMGRLGACDAVQSPSAAGRLNGASGAGALSWPFQRRPDPAAERDPVAADGGANRPPARRTQTNRGCLQTGVSAGSPRPTRVKVAPAADEIIGARRAWREGQ